MIRLHKLEIHNLLSLESATIDFRRDLGESGLVLICGRTGAGKSAILDAICLALYGKSPRLERGGRENFSVDGKELKSSDVSQLMRRGAVEASCELTFETSGGDLYCATWEIHRARRSPEGNLLPPSRTLIYPDGAVLEKGVADEVIRVVGLSYDDFRQTVLLAQGDFTRFLFSLESERSAILEHLTGMSDCTVYGKRIYEITKQLRQEYQTRQQAADSVILLSREELRAERGEMKQLRAQVRDNSREVDQLTRRRASLALLHKAREALRRCEEQWRALESSYATQQSALTQLYLELDTQRSDREAVEKQLAKRAPLAPMYQRAELLDHSLGQLSGYWSEEKSNALEEEKKGEKLEQLRKTLKKSAESIRPIEEQLARLATSIDKLTKQQEELDYEALTARHSLLEDQLESNRSQLTLLSERAKLMTLTEKSDAVARSLEEAKKQRDEAEVRYEKIKASTGEVATRLRHDLVPGDRCPVCGGAVHEILSDSHFEEMLRPLREECDQMKSAVTGLEGQAKAVREAVIKCSSAIEARERQIRTLVQRHGEGLTLGSSEAEVRALLKTTPQEICRVEVDLKRARECRTQLEALRKEQSSVDRELKGLQEQKHQMEISISALEAELKTLRQRKGQLSESEQALLAELTPQMLFPNWVDQLRADEQALRSRLRTEASDFLSLRDRLEQLTQRLEEQTRRLERLSALSAKISEALPSVEAASHGPAAPTVESCEEELRQISHSLDTLRESRAGAEAEIAQLIETQPELSMLSEEKVATAITDLQQRSNRLMEDLGDRMGRMRLDREARQSHKALLEENARLQVRLGRWERLNELLGNADGKKYRGIAQGYILSYLLESANQFLIDLESKYRLFSSPQSSAILVQDRYTGTPPQSAKVLSGGESFIVALSLSLALSQLRGESVVDTLFMDEGFGTLDPTSLDQVMEALERLHERMDRRIVLISHVQELRERIATKLLVEPVDVSRSRVRLVRGASTV